MVERFEEESGVRVGGEGYFEDGVFRVFESLGEDF